MLAIARTADRLRFQPVIEVALSAKTLLILGKHERFDLHRGLSFYLPRKIEDPPPVLLLTGQRTWSHRCRAYL